MLTGVVAVAAAALVVLVVVNVGRAKGSLVAGVAIAIENIQMLS